jgi:hypothetical protein
MPSVSERRRPLTAAGKARLVVRSWVSFARLLVWRRRYPLPNLVRRIVDEPARRLPYDVRPVRVGRIVVRSLEVGPVHARCLTNALVHLRILRQQGEDAALVIGLPELAPTKDAHAWVELDGRDVGPPPGRGVNEALARYPG